MGEMGEKLNKIEYQDDKKKGEREKKIKRKEGK